MQPLAKQHITAILLFLSTTFFAVTSHGQWLHTAKNNDVAYFLFAASPRLERYALTNHLWLNSVTLPSVYGLPSTFCVDESGLYIAYGKTVKRYDLQGANEFHILNTVEPVESLFTDGNLLLINRASGSYARITSVNKQTGTVIAELSNYNYAVHGASIARSNNRLFGRNSYDISYIAYNDSGTFTTYGESSHNGPYATKTWLFPNEAKVVDDSGTVYSTGNLSYVNSIGGAIKDIDFYGVDIPIVLRDSTLTAYSNALLPTGSRVLSYRPRNIHVAGTNVFTFTWDTTQTNGIRANAVPLSRLNPPTPGQPVDPVGLSFRPDFSFLDTNSVLYLFSKKHQSLFRWSTTDQTYLSTIPLVEVPSFAAYSPVTHRTYIAYSSGLIRQIDLASTNFTETPFANVPMSPTGLSTAGEYVFATDDSGAWGSHYTFDSSGTRISSKDWNYYSTEFIWSEPNQKMYFFRDDTSPNDLLWEQINADGITYSNLAPGAIGNDMDSPLHGDYGFMHPIRVSPDGSIVVLGSGAMHNAATLARLSVSLVNAVNDITWSGGEMKTVRTISGLAQFQAWNSPNYAPGVVRQVPGSALRLFSVKSNSLLGITLQAGIPNFYVMDRQFNILPPPVLPTPSNLTARIISTTQVNIGWDDVIGEETYAIERKIGSAETWTEIGTSSTSSTNYFDGSVMVGTVYDYRIIARNGNKVSSPSSPMSVSLTIPTTPTNFVASPISASAIRLTWSDTQYENVFLVERRIGTDGNWTQIAVVPTGITVYTNTALLPDTHYYYRVRGTNGIGSSAYSQTTVTLTDAVRPAAPTLSTANAINSYSIALGWWNVAYESSYVIERRIGTNGTWNVLITVGRDVVSYTDNSVIPLTTYEYRLYATNRAGASSYSNVKRITTPQLPPPPAPTGLTARVLSKTTVALVWNDVAGETGYRVQRRTENTNSWVTVTTLAPSITSCTVSNLVEGVQYFFRIQAFNQIGNSPFSQEATATPYNITRLLEDDFDPSISRGVWNTLSGGIATNGGSGFRGNKALWFGSSGNRQVTTIPLDVTRGATLEFLARGGNQDVNGNAFWNNSELGETVLLEYSKDNGSTWTLIQPLNSVYPSLSNWTSFSITLPYAALSTRTQFRWRQPFHSGVGFDTWALDNVAILGFAPAPPLAPVFIISSTSSSTSIAVYWSQSTGATSYVLERRTGITNWIVAATTPVTQTFFTDTTVRPGTAYTYRVKAANAGGQSGYSPTTTAVPPSQQLSMHSDYGDATGLSKLEMQTPGMESVSALLRFAFNLTSPESMRPLTTGAKAGWPAVWVDKTKSRLGIEFVRRKASSNPGITYEVQFSSDMKNWTAGGTQVSQIGLDATWEKVRYVDNATNSNFRFCRVVIIP